MKNSRQIETQELKTKDVQKAIERKDHFIEPHQACIEKAKIGDQQAMHDLFLSYSKGLLNTSYRIVNSREDAEDVLQESFVKIFSRLGDFRYQSTFGAWAKRIVVNQSLDQLKRKNRWVEISNEIPHEQEITDSEADLPDSKEALQCVIQTIAQLPDGYRTVLSLYMLEGYDHKEIAQILEIDVSTSISQLSRAKKKLKSLVLNKLRDEESR